MIRYCFVFFISFFLFSCSSSSIFSNKVATNNSNINASSKSALKNITENTYIHVVKYKGESLSNIASWYTGRIANWEELASFNSIYSPYTIELGQAIIIPNRLLVKTTSLPENMIIKPKKKRTFAAKKSSGKEVIKANIKRASLKVNKNQIENSGENKSTKSSIMQAIKNTFGSAIKDKEEASAEDSKSNLTQDLAGSIAKSSKEDIKASVSKSAASKAEKLDLEKEMSKIEMDKSLNLLDRFKKVISKPIFK